MVIDVKPKCVCGRKLAPVPAAESDSAISFVVKRTCRRCKTRWQVKTSLLAKREGVLVHKAELVAIN